MRHPWKQRGFFLFMLVGLLAGSERGRAQIVASRDVVIREETRVANQLRSLGGYAFLNSESGRVVEVNLNRNPRVTDQDLENVGKLSGLTDVSLEGTKVGDAGMVFLKGLRHLEWLNLYQTQISDDGLRQLSEIVSLQHLPIGGTRITDAGLLHLKPLKDLQYLGLRGTRVSDRGLDNLRSLTNLTGLHLGETAILGTGLSALKALPKLDRLWLDQTGIGDGSLPVLLSLQQLRELHVAATKLSPEAIARLRRGLPACRIVDREE